MQAAAAIIAAVLVAGCGNKSSQPPPTEGSGSGSGSGSASTKPPDDMDEKMRHCPLSVEGAQVAWSASAAGIRWEVTAKTPAAADEIKKRAHHVVEFAAGHAEKGVHGGGKGGGTMRNCPVVTRGVTITVTDLPYGAGLVVAAVNPEDAPALVTDTETRLKAFSFPGVVLIHQTAP